MTTTFPWTDFVPHRSDALHEYRTAVTEMGERKYTQAAQRLEWIIAQPSDHGHALTDVRELLARAYYHSAQLHKAEATVRALLSDRPDHGWAVLLLGRTLQRQGRSAEAEPYLARARAMGEDAA